MLAPVGIELPTASEQGVCGTCVTHLISGAPDQRDVYLTPQEQPRSDQFMPCCSRAKDVNLALEL
jgi:vanillate O-demethylase ferredoxin subunit